MNTHQPLDRFETALLAELREHVATRAAVPTRAPRRRRLAAVGATAVTAGAVAVTALVLRPEAAYAVDREADGDVVVTIASLDDAEGLERALEAEGVDAEVEYDATAEPMVPPADELDQAEPAEPGWDEGGTGEQHEYGDDPDSGAMPLPQDPALEGQCLTSIGTEVGEEGITFRLPATAVDSDAVLHIVTSGDVDDWGSIGVRWEGDPC